jgi:hypothetical protein
LSNDGISDTLSNDGGSNALSDSLSHPLRWLSRHPAAEYAALPRPR